MALVTDWRLRANDLPVVPSGGSYNHEITPQKPVTLCRIYVDGLHLVGLRIGNVEIPFRLAGADKRRRRYSPKIAPADREKLLRVQSVSQPSADDEIAVVAGLDVCLTLINERSIPVKLCAALIVREEIL